MAVDRLGRASNSLTGGMRIPSWKISVASEPLPPAVLPPTSVWWPMLTDQPTRRSPTKIGLNR